MLEKLKSLLVPAQKIKTRHYSAPERAIHVGPKHNDVPYMFVWAETLKHENSEETNERIAFEFRNMPKVVVRFDQRAIPELIAALTHLQTEIEKNDQPQH